MGCWLINDAKNRISDLLEDAHTKGPQVITRHGKERAVVLSIEKYRALTAHKPDFKDYLLGGPKFDDSVIERLNERDMDLGRTIDFSDQ